MRIALFLAGIVAAAAFAAPPLAHADIYKWIDEKGVMNFTNMKPPAGAKNVERFKEERITVVPAAVSSEQIAARRELELQARVERLERQLYEAQQPAAPIGYDPSYGGYDPSQFPMFDYPFFGGYPAFGPSWGVGGGRFRHFPIVRPPIVVKPVPGSTIGGSLIFGRPVFAGQVFGQPVFGSPIVGTPLAGTAIAARSGHARAGHR